MFTRTVLLLPVFALAAACGPAVTITRDASLPIYPRTTYAWGVADSARTAAERNAARVEDSVRTRIEQAVDAELALRGFRKAPFADAQLVVHYHIGMQRVVAMTPAIPVCSGRPCSEQQMEWGYWGSPERAEHDEPYTQGSLMLDFLARPGLKLAWRGLIIGEVTDQSSSEANIRRGVAKLLKQFPGS